ncbi:MAG: response regulator transcription factor [Verrucomicrobiae bacterium]|nr:response regulator transcription factor [Verrucomicrobiae bacterium]
MRVLFVEDSQHLQKPIVKALKASGYAVDATTDGKEGLWMAQNHDYDVIILDIMLPGMDGLEILDTLRANSNRTPILFLTARDTVANRVEGLRRGADDYLVKPFALEELLARVESLSRRRYDRPTSTVTLDDLVIDLTRKTVKRSGQRIELAARQFALLEYLMLRQGEVVSRTEIEEHIYDDLVSPMSNVIDSAICALRKQIAPLPNCKPLIHTRRGLGYVMEARDAS